MRKIVVIILLLTSIASSYVGANSTVYKTWDHIYKQEKKGIRQYQKGKYEQAFDSLRVPAQTGLKDAQYALAFMYLKGLHVPQSLEIGMAWLGVANEIGIEEWQETFDMLYAQVSPELQNKIDQKVSEYIQMYGMETQNLTCTRQARTGSRRVRLNCMKMEGTTPLYELEEVTP